MPRPKSYYCADIKCPFYKADDGHSMVSCEGVEKATCVKLSFYVNEPQNEKGRLKDFIYRKCADDFKSCPIYKMIMAANYPEEEK